MTFKQAYNIAMERSATFRKHDAEVKKAEAAGEMSACMQFSVQPGEVWYYGFDGLDMQKGKHTRKRSEWMIEHSKCLIIL